MNLRRLMSLTIIFMIVGYCSAQELKIVSFQRLDRDLLARTQERLDLNEEPCAVLRVSVSNAKEYTFEGNIIGEINYRPGEAIIYMTKGSRNLTIKSDKFGTLKYDFSERLEKQVVYKLTLKLEIAEANKIRTLVMPQFAIGTTYSYGLMIAVVKKWGGYIKAKYNFKNLSTEGTCTDDGMVNGSPVWFTGGKESSRLDVTGGVLVRLALPLYMYFGAGYGYKKLAWESVEKDLEDPKNRTWYENSDQSYEGVEAELGLILRLKNIAISAGCQTNSFKYVEATVGLGLMF